MDNWTEYEKWKASWWRANLAFTMWHVSIRFGQFRKQFMAGQWAPDWPLIGASGSIRFCRSRTRMVMQFHDFILVRIWLLPCWYVIMCNLTVTWAGDELKALPVLFLCSAQFTDNVKNYLSRHHGKIEVWADQRNFQYQMATSQWSG